MNLLDIALIVLLVIPAVVGLFKGLVNVATAFVGIWAAFLLAPLARGLLAPSLESWLGDAGLASVLAYGAGFAATVLLAGLVGWLLTRSLRKLDLQWANRLAGLALGLGCGLLLGGVAVAACRTASPDSAFLRDSTLAPPIGKATGFLIALRPPERPAEPAARPDPGAAESGDPGARPEVVEERDQTDG